MSKMRRKPVTPPDFLSDTPKLDDVEQAQDTDELQAAAQAQTEDEPETVAAEQTPADGGVRPSKDLAKVMTNDLTPRCPFCLSPRLEPLTMENPWGRKWVCNNCCTAFREPVKGKSA